MQYELNMALREVTIGDGLSQGSNVWGESVTC